MLVMHYSSKQSSYQIIHLYMQKWRFPWKDEGSGSDGHSMKAEMPRLTWFGNPSESAGPSEVRVLTNNSREVPENQPR